MLGRTAGSLFWTFRYLARAETMARLLDGGFRNSLTRSDRVTDEWVSILESTGTHGLYRDQVGEVKSDDVIEFLLQSEDNPSSVLCCFRQARTNGRAARTALTREMWEALNEAWLRLKTELRSKVGTNELTDTLALVLQYCALVRGAMSGTMLRNDTYDFACLGTHVERADSTARLLDVNAEILTEMAGRRDGMERPPVDMVRWDTVLRSTSTQRGFRWLYPGELDATHIARFFIIDRRMPRSLVHCAGEVKAGLERLSEAYEIDLESCELSRDLFKTVRIKSVEPIFERGLAPFLSDFLTANAKLSDQIEIDFRFYS